MARVGVENDKCKMTEEKSFQPVIVVHGGAWSVPDDISESTLTGVKEAAKTGYRLLCDGSSGVDAVVATVAELEDNPLYDAGRGSVLNVEGEIEMHALVMSGDTLKTGGVISTRSIKNPVKAAKLVMDETEHCVMSGNGAEAFARKHGIEEKPLDYFITPAAKQELDMFLEANITMDAFFNKLNRGHDTVGAVAIDKKGNLACATSTGGISGQIVGRVSDCPLPGCGGYADNNSVAVVSTGHGESIIKICLARLVSFHVDQGKTPQESVTYALDLMRERLHGTGGAIAVDRQGRVGINNTTERMSWAVIGSDPDDSQTDPSRKNKNIDQLHVTFGINPGEQRKEVFLL